VPTPIRDYFDRTNPIVYDTSHDVPKPEARDIYRAWDRLARQLYVTLPNQLDRARSFRNRYIRAVR
jgi:hypothetical protein